MKWEDEACWGMRTVAARLLSRRGSKEAKVTAGENLQTGKILVGKEEGEGNCL